MIELNKFSPPPVVIMNSSEVDPNSDVNITCEECLMVTAMISMTGGLIGGSVASCVLHTPKPFIIGMVAGTSPGVCAKCVRIWRACLGRR